MKDYTELKRAAEAATQGEWQVIETELPCRIGRPHVERRIFTAKDHPQLKAPYPVVNGSVALGTDETPVHHMVSMTAEDAAYIAAASPAAVLDLIAENERLNAENKQLIALECHGGAAEAAINLLADRDQLKAENEALRDHLRLRVSAMPRDRLRETFNAAYYGPRELGSDGEQCRAGVIAVIDSAMGKGEQS